MTEMAKRNFQPGRTPQETEAGMSERGSNQAGTTLGLRPGLAERNAQSDRGPQRGKTEWLREAPNAGNVSENKKQDGAVAFNFTLKNNQLRFGI